MCLIPSKTLIIKNPARAAQTLVCPVIVKILAHAFQPIIKLGWYSLNDQECSSSCPRGCICESGSDICISCIQDFHLVDNSCIHKDHLTRLRDLSTCKVGRYECSESCCACTSMCMSCYMNMSNILECTICATNYYIFEGATYYRCIPVCPNEYYKGTSSPLRCERCIANCLICNDGNTCTECKAGSFIKFGICVSDCGAGYYQNVSTGTCDSCSANCITCTASECSQCDSSTYYKDGTCVSSCGIGYYANNTTRICERCSINCQTCAYVISVLTCTECMPGTHMKGI